MRRLLALLAIGVAAVPAQAALIEMDWTLAGDGAITLDDQSGLEWLDWSVTKNLSYNSVSAQLGAGGAYDGFRYASQAELLQLYGNVGFTYPTGPNAGNIPLAQTFTSLFGITFGSAPPNNGGVEALYEHSTVAGQHWVTAINHNDGLVRPEWFQTGDDSAINFVGSALVRGEGIGAVPVPAAGLLMLSALGGLGLARRRKKA